VVVVARAAVVVVVVGRAVVAVAVMAVAGLEKAVAREAVTGRARRVTRLEAAEETIRHQSRGRCPSPSMLNRRWRVACEIIARGLRPRADSIGSGEPLFGGRECQIVLVQKAKLDRTRQSEC
jgi:hypothetical protein